MPENPRSLTTPIETSRPRPQRGLAMICVLDEGRLTVRSVAAEPGWPLPVPAQGEDLLAFLRARITDPSLVDALASAAELGNPGMVSLYFSDQPDGHRVRWLPLPGGEISCHIAPPAPAFRTAGQSEPPEGGATVPDQMVWGGRIVDGRVILEFVTGGFPSILRSRWDPLRLMDEWLAAIHPDDREQALARFGEVRADSPPRSSEYRVLRPDGTLRWVRSTVAPFAGVYPDLGVWAIITDITEERATRLELEHLLGMVRDLVIEIGWDASGTWFVRSLSPSAAGLLGVERAGPLEVGAEFERRLHPDDLPLLDGALRRLRAGASSERVALRLTTATGNVVRLEGALVTAQDADAGPRVLGMLSNVTERRAAEARLRRIAEVVEPVLCEAEMLPDGRWSFPYMSPSAARLMGAPLPADPAEAAAAFLGAIHVDDVQQVAAAAERVLRDGGSVAVDYRHVRADGEIRRVRSTMARFIGDDGRPRLAAVKTDLTDQWEAQESAQRVLASVGAVALEIEVLRDGRWSIERAGPELERLVGRGLPADPVQAGGVLFRSIHPDDRHRVVLMREQLRTAVSVTDEYRVVHPGGEVRWVRVTVARGTPTRRHVILLDITGERSAGDRLRRVLDSLDEVIVEGEVGDDDRWHATYASPPVDRLLACALPDDPAARARALDDAIHPADRPVLARELRALSRRGGGGAVTVRIIRADGEVRWIRANMARRDAPPGRPALAGVVADVTELLQTGQALLRAERGLNRLVSGANAIAYEARLVDGDWVLAHIGPNAGPLLGVEMPAEPVARTRVWLDHMEEEDRAALLKAFAGVRSGGGAVSLEFRVRGAHGQIRLRAGVARIAPDLVGGVISDVSEVMDADDALRTAQARLMRVIAAMGEAVYEVRVTKDGRPKLTYASPQLWRLYGVDGPQDRQPLEIVHPDDRDLVATRLMRTLEGVPLAIDYRVVWPDGQIRWIRATGRPRLQEDGSVLVAGTKSDVTDERASAADAPSPRVKGDPAASRLTGRQMAVLELLAEGAGTDEIAVRLQITRTTVANHVAAILRRLGARSRLEAVHVARREGLLSDD